MVLANYSNGNISLLRNLVPVPGQPVITSQPQNQSVLSGQTALFTVSATGETLSYQWKRNGSNLLNDGTYSGVGTPTLTVSNVGPSHAGNLTVEISNTLGTTLSSNAVLAIAIPPAITSQPSSQNVIVGRTALFSVAASGTAPLSYHWRKNGGSISDGGNISGAATAMLQISGVSQADEANYSVVVSNAWGTAQSSNAVLAAVQPVCTSPPSGLVGWWSGNGTTADHAGTNNGTLFGHTAYASGKVGQGFVFDGTSDGVRLANAPNLQTQDFTIETWVRRNNTNQVSSSIDGGLIFGYGTGGYAFGLLNSGTMYLSKVGSSQVNSSVQITDTNFHHVALTKSNSTIIFYVNGTAYPANSYNPGFTFGTSPAIGARGDTLGNSFWGSIDELSFYNRALSAPEIQSIYTASYLGKCDVAPTIVTHPQSQTATVGSNVTLTVSATGSIPLSYQWLVNGTTLTGATASSLTLTNVQMNQAGNYSVVVSNSAGSASSSNALLTVVLPPASVRVISTNAMSGTSVTVPITLTANGNENALGFSLSFDPQELVYASTTLSTNASGASLLLNTSQAASGKVGIAVALPSEATFAPGTKDLVHVTFNSPVSTNGVVAAIAFADQPTARQVSDPEAQPLPATYSGGTVTLSASDLEGDVTPRPNGNRILSITDWVQVGRFAAKLDIPAAGGEFQRADCAPRNTLGDGKIKVTDWVQAGRYAAGLDPLTAAGGPTAESPQGNLVQTKTASSSASPNREVRVADANGIQDVLVSVPVQLVAQGNENALGFSLTFDATHFAFNGISAGSGAPGATMNINTNEISSGKVGVILALPTGSSFATGTQEAIQLKLVPTASGVGTCSVTFGDQPVSREISDPSAYELTANYVAGNVTVNPLPLLSVQKTGTSTVLAWPAWAHGFNLQTATNPLISGNWTNVAGPFQTNGGTIGITLPAEGDIKLFRLHHP